ncbi:hypothetical protein [Polaribacter sp. M15]
MNKIKLLTVVLIVVFSSCSTKKQDKAIFLDNPNVFRIELENGEKEIVKKNYEDDFIFEDWNAYNMVHTQLSLMKNEEYKISKNRIIYLKKFINNLSTTMPNWLQNTSVNQEIDDVETQFDTLIEQLDESTQVIRANCRELNQEFNELQKEVKNTVKNYTNS